MIISHKHKFIFIHLGRTAGRSLTVALAPHCGEEDIITPAGKVPGRNNRGFTRHFTALEIRNAIGRERFEEYFKFTIERNPWEKIVSRYWAYAGDPEKSLYKRIPEWVLGRPLTFKEWFELRILQARFLTFGHYRFPRHWPDYTENDRLLVDFIGRYENLTAHLAVLSDRLGFPITLTARRGTALHKQRIPYTELFDDRMRQIVEAYFAKDLAFLGYRFGEPPPLDYIEPRRRERVTASAAE
jgi:hypothetical protein